ncbi:uncharacterized protein [Rutidosis leptorrhynchoides]|uniref:uncharacterized protein n=1 Tax=Rutidosis leptorrhynchoides TaxID=125765 RepID=UPI003A998C95
MFLEAEIKQAVWDRGSDKYPRPDGFTFTFVKHFWEAINGDIIAAVQNFESSGSIPRGWPKQTAFIKGCQILDGPLIINEIVDCWIRACLLSSKASLLLNSSPSAEFDIERGPYQGDPLSPLLFIIDMEGINAAMKDATASKLFSGLSVNNHVTICHCFHADDALFLGEWNDSNAANILTILG